MKITKEMLASMDTYTEGLNTFIEQAPETGADYQEVLNFCASHDMAGFAIWLMDSIGIVPDAIIWLLEGVRP
jgi:ferritin